MEVLYPLGFILVALALLFYLRSPGPMADYRHANYERAHPYGPCNPDELSRLQSYMDDIAFVRRQETVHDACEGHAICDLIASIEMDYRVAKLREKQS